ncbi:Uma2 family endonuclease [Alkalinema sp. FACHB-956]|uniref:Uma2 family endonuclease n=1 Tax=Alkalinema sp. FACHB-956 TaxID=2692768 RepID=UPI001682FD41|nr:Uma2 family endonuclease [Alkalinema sp. FACHB-956]MBD2327300.1 Uma2 family endonuclease [Alkalinema sp. FACHB-956]
MTVAIPKRISLEEYLTYDDGTEVRYELVDGILVNMGTESTINTLIAVFLMNCFWQLGLPHYRIGIKQKIQVARTHASAREPDLIIHSEESLAALMGRSEACLKLNEPNPLIVIEVVSPGTKSSENYQRDYHQKPVEYAARGISEMWIIDPDRAVVKVGNLTDGTYRFQDFRSDDTIVSPTFPELSFSVGQVLSGGR